MMAILADRHEIVGHVLIAYALVSQVMDLLRWLFANDAKTTVNRKPFGSLVPPP